MGNSLELIFNNILEIFIQENIIKIFFSSVLFPMVYEKKCSII